MFDWICASPQTMLISPISSRWSAFIHSPVCFLRRNFLHLTDTLGIIGKAYGKIWIVIDKLNSEIWILFNNLPFAAIMRILIDYLNNNVRVIISHLDSEIRMLCHNLNPAIQRNTFACARIPIDGLSGDEQGEQCEYKTTYKTFHTAKIIKNVYNAQR